LCPCAGSCGPPPRRRPSSSSPPPPATGLPRTPNLLRAGAAAPSPSARRVMATRFNLPETGRAAAARGGVAPAAAAALGAPLALKKAAACRPRLSRGARLGACPGRQEEACPQSPLRKQRARLCLGTAHASVGATLCVGSHAGAQTAHTRWARARRRAAARRAPHALNARSPRLSRVSSLWLLQVAARCALSSVRRPRR
jgi:hypothetical protein